MEEFLSADNLIFSGPVPAVEAGVHSQKVLYLVTL